MELTVIDNKGKSTGSVQIEDRLVQYDANPALLHEVVVAHLANQRSGTHATKNRAEVSGGGVKPWRQKGTGRARSGSIRSPLWRKGGVIFGPNPRDYTQDLPKKKKKGAFRLAIRHIIEENRLQVVEPVTVAEPKTKLVAAVFAKWNAPHGSLYVVDKITPEFRRVSRNIAAVAVADAESLNAYDVLRARKVFITKPAFDLLVARLAKNAEKN